MTILWTPPEKPCPLANFGTEYTVARSFSLRPCSATSGLDVASCNAVVRCWVAGKGWAMRFISCPCRAVQIMVCRPRCRPQCFVCAFPMWFEGLRKITMPCRQLDRKPRTSFAPGFRFGSTQMISKASFRISYNNVVVCLILLFPQSHPRTLQVYANNTSVACDNLKPHGQNANKNDYFRGLEQSTSKAL